MHVVEAHHQVGDDDRAHRRRTAGRRPATSWPSPSSSAISLMPIHSSSTPPTSLSYGSCSSCTAKNVSTIRSTTAPAAPQMMPQRRWRSRQVAAGERDHHRVVARQQDVDDDDLERRDPELRRAEFHAGPTPRPVDAQARVAGADAGAVTDYSTDFSSLPISAGLRVTLMPHASMTASFSCAVPLPPEMMRAGVAHALARRRGDAGDEADDRLLHVVLAPSAPRLFVGPPISPIMMTASVSGIVVEELHHVDVLQAVDRVAADADRASTGRGRARSAGRPLRR